MSSPILRMASKKPKLSIMMAGKVSAALAATAGATGGQEPEIGAQAEAMGSDDDRKPPAASQKGGEESDDEPEPATGSGYTSEDQALFSAEDLGRKKLLDMCGVKSSLAYEIKLRAEGKSDVQVAKEFDRMVQNTPPPPV